MATPTYVYSPPNRESLSANPAKSQKGVKYRIYNLFKTTIVLDELSLPKNQTSDSKKMEDLASLQYPLIKINNYFISEFELDYMSIKSNNFLPTITLQVTFTNNKFMDRELPKDGDIISIAIRNKSDVLNIIRNDYVITGVTTSKRRSAGNTPLSFTFFGELFVPGLRGCNSGFYKGTTLETTKTVAQELHLGFNTNDQNTDDKQNWFLTRDTYQAFIEEIVQKAWKDENSFYDCWIDIYYNLNFVNIQKQLLSAEDDIDEAVVLNNIDSDWTWGSDTAQDNSHSSVKVFSNLLGFRTSPFYINEWSPINKSSAVTFQYGASIQTGFFEHLNSLYENPDNKKYWYLDINSTYDKEKLGNHIILRGRSTYDASTNEGELAMANYNYNDLYKQNTWMGIQYTITNVDDDTTNWTGNQHKNYLRAQIHNCINRVELEKLNVEISIQGTNLNVIRGDKVPVVIMGLDSVENMMVDPNAEGRDRKNEFYSGWYLVKGFTLTWVKQDSIVSNFTQSFTLTRREWPTPIPIDGITVNK